MSLKLLTRNSLRSNLFYSKTLKNFSFSLQLRNLNLQEYQSKTLLGKNDVYVEKFGIARTPEDAINLAKKLNLKKCVVKSQILAGGKGKGTFADGFKSGVHIVNSPEEAAAVTKKMLNNRLITKQTPPSGVPVRIVSVNEPINSKSETYFALLMDRESNGPVMVGSPRGGMNIEEVAAKEPGAIFTEPINVETGVTDEQALKMAKNLGFSSLNVQKLAATSIKNMYKTFASIDATQLEINPFAETTDGKVVCMDAKIKIDDNAAYRQKELFGQQDTSDSDPRELEAAKYDLNYIGLDGNIGCLVNGAGLAMATMDIIKLHGGEPANFLDVGGAVTETQVEHAFKLLTADTQVKAILVNVFGGIVNCATMANGIIKACKSVHLDLPLVVRLEGTNVNAAKEILENSGLKITPASDFTDAAKKVVAAIQ